MKNEKTIEFDFQNLSTKFFEGFYESNLFNSDSILNAASYFEDEDMEKIDDNFNFTNFKNDFGKEFSSILRDFDEENLFEKIEFLNFKSPKYYNYSTDKICLKIVANEDFKKYIEEKRQEIYNYFKDLTFESILNNEYEFLQLAVEFYFIQIMEENESFKIAIYEAAQNCIYSEIQNCL